MLASSAGKRISEEEDEVSSSAPSSTIVAFGKGWLKAVCVLVLTLNALGKKAKELLARLDEHMLTEREEELMKAELRVQGG